MGKERGGGNNVVRSERKGEERERQGGVAERERRVQGGVRRERERSTRWCEHKEKGTRWCEQREREEDDKVVRREGEKVV